MQPVVKVSEHGSYLGCDLFLSSEWGQGLLSIIPNETRSKLNASTDSNIFSEISTFGDCDIADLAAKLRPRYHFACGHGVYVQAPVYRNVGGGSSTADRKFHGTRFISLNDLDEDAGKDKVKKWIHAIGIETLTAMERDVLLAEAPNTVESPYGGEDFEKVNSIAANQNSTSYGVSEASARRLMSDDARGEQYRWSGRGIDNNAQRKRRQEDISGGISGGAQRAVDPNSDTLFMHGLNKDPGGLVNAHSLMSLVGKFGCTDVRLPPGKPYGFLVFSSHQQAESCLTSCNGGLNISGIFIGLRWATNSTSSGRSSAPDGGDAKKSRVSILEKDCPDSEVLFFTFPKSVPREKFDDCSEMLRKLTERLLENAINGDGTEGDRVTSETEPALKVSSRMAFGGKGFGFLMFASHAAAAMAIACLTGDTDGGTLSRDAIGEAIILENLSVYWSKSDKSTLLRDQKVCARRVCVWGDKKKVFTTKKK